MPSIYNALNNRMDFLVARQGMIAGNIANADTPGYTARDLVMDKNNAAKNTFAMMVTNAGHLRAASGASMGGGTVVEGKGPPEHNGNNVRLDQEMLHMNETQMDYRLMTELYAKQVAMQKLALGSR